VDTNPRSRYSPFIGSAFTDLQQELHHIGKIQPRGLSN
jgi:hypothetical protein